MATQNLFCQLSAFVANLQLYKCLCEDNGGIASVSFLVHCSIPQAMTHTVASYLIEVLLRSVPDATYAKVLEKHFSGKCMEMAVHRSANFIVQRLLSSTRSEEQVSM